MNALRALSVDGQVALLFVALLGGLLLLSLALLVRTLRDDGSARERLHPLWRDLRALWLGAVVFWLAWVSGPVGATVAFGVFSFLALREFITLVHTRRGDHRSLLLAFFVALPFQYLLVGLRAFDLFTVFVPVYVFLLIPVASAISGDPHRFLERSAKLQWGIMVCVYGMSHVPALLLLQFPKWGNKGAFLVFFLVFVVQTGTLVQHLVSRRWPRPPRAPNVSQSFNWTSWSIGVATGSVLGGVLSGITPFKPGQAMAMALIACVAGSMGHLVMKALKRDRGVPNWGAQGQSVTGASGLLDRVDALCFAAPVFFHSVRWYFGA